MMQEQFKFDKETLLKVGRGCLIAGGGAGITYLLQELPKIDFGQWTPAVVGIASIALNTLWQWFKGDKNAKDNTKSDS